MPAGGISSVVPTSSNATSSFGDPNAGAQNISNGASNGGWGGYGPGGGLLADGSQGGFAVNPNVVADNINNDNSLAQQYYAASQGGTTSLGPLSQNQYAGQSQQELANTYAGQNHLAGQLQNTIQNPGSSLAAQQYQQNAQQGMNATTALGTTAGGGVTGAGARRGAQEANGMQAAANSAGLQATEAQAQQAAQGQLGSLLGQQGSLANGQYSAENAFAANNASLTQQDQQLNNGAQLGYIGLSQKEQGNATNAATQYQNALLGLANASNAEQQTSNSFGNAMLGLGTGVTTGVASGLAQIANGVNQDNKQSSGPSESQLENPYYNPPGS